MNWSDYLADPAESASSLRTMLVSPRMYRWWRDNRREDKDALRVGRAAHTAILEPHLFARQYVVWSGGRRYGKKWDEFRAENADRTILTEQQLSDTMAISQAVRAHGPAAALLAEPGQAELSMFWVHERTGIRCKGRIDWLCPSSLVDVKTCRDPAPCKFSAAAARLGYHVPLAFYQAGLLMDGRQPRPVRIIAAQNIPPYDVAVYRLADEALIWGETLYERALDTLAECQRTGLWPGLAPEEELLRLPAWATPDQEDVDLDAMFGAETLEVA